MARTYTDINTDTDIQRIAAAPAVPWQPTDLGAALKFFVHADDHGTALMTDDGGGLISSLKDRVASLTGTAATTVRPIWAANSFNTSYAGLTLDGVDDCLTFPTTGLPVGATGGAMFVIASNIETINSSNTFMAYGAGVAVDRVLLRFANVGVSRLRVTNSSTVLTDTVTVLDGPNLMLGTWNGTTMAGRLNGSDTTPASTTMATLATGVTRLRIGGGVAAGTTFHKGVFRIGIITTDLTALQIQQLEGWGAWNNGLVAKLPAGHPYKLGAP